MDVTAYLKRIGYEGSREPSAETLRLLHRAHMFTVPFENLDIALGHTIELSLPSFYEKIVRRRRGGFCYELNGLFGWLLEQLGFAVVTVSARVYSDGKPGRDFAHMFHVVELEDRLIADVGFGDSFLEPLRLDSTEENVQCGSSYRITVASSERVLEQRRPGSDWEPQHIFSLTPRQFVEFGPMCDWTQTSPDSIFTRKTVCSLPTQDGRITLANGRLIVTTANRREERAVATEQEYRELLKSRFGIELEQGERVDKLMVPSQL